VRPAGWRWLACSTSMREEEEGDQLGWVGQKVEQANWPLGRLGRKRGKIPFRIKIGILNLQRLWKFLQGDFGGILMWDFP
jgi:hypothetical protein